MGKGKPRGLNSARKLRVHRRNKYVDYFKIKKKLSTPYCDIVLGELRSDKFISNISWRKSVWRGLK